MYVDYDNDGVQDADEPGLVGVAVQLIGVDDLGQTVSLAVTTGAGGAYSFTGLRAGTYSILEAQPAGYADGIDSVGSLGGFLFNDDAEGNDKFYDVLLGWGQDGTDYNFGERPQE